MVVVVDGRHLHYREHNHPQSVVIWFEINFNMNKARSIRGLRLRNKGETKRREHD